MVNASYEVIVPLTLRGPAGQTRDIEAVLDTGFSEFLMLPPALVSELWLPFVTSDLLLLASGAAEPFQVYSVTVLWDGQPRDVYAHVSDTTPLVGMALLHDHRLTVDVVVGGPVGVQAIA